MSIALLAGCGDAKPDTAASDAAKAYYDKLLGGDYDGYVDGMYFSDSIPANYRAQLVANAKMFVAEQAMAHGGIDTVIVLHQQRDSAAVTAEVFMLVAFCDSVREEIVVPMIDDNGTWRMR